MYGFAGRKGRKIMAGNRPLFELFGGKDADPILTDVKDKVSFFNQIGIHYEAVYHYVIRRRQQEEKIYKKDFLDDITAGLISFDMQRFMGNKKKIENKEQMGNKKYMAEAKAPNNDTEPWVYRLKNVLDGKQTISILRSLRKEVLQKIDLTNGNFPGQISSIFDELSKEGSGRLSLRKNEKFPVGASKILHFLIPDLFIILDSNARDQLHKCHKFKKSDIDGESYLAAMKCYQAELKNWQDKENDPDFAKLFYMDSSWQKFGGARLTPLPRIIDKCTFVGNEYPTLFS